MILIITNRGDYTVDFLILRLQELEEPYIRINTEDFPFHALAVVSSKQKRLSLEKSGRTLDLSKVEGVWYRRPESPVFPPDFDPDSRDFVNRECREFLEGLWRCTGSLWVNHPDKIRMAANKVEQLDRMAAMGLKMPDTVVTNDPEVARSFYETHSEGIIAKTLRESHGRLGDRGYVIYTNLVSKDHFGILETVRYSPVIFQENIEKLSDIRVTVVGPSVFATEIHSQENIVTRTDWRRDTLSLRHTVHTLPPDVEKQCLRLVRSYGLVFAGIDLVKTRSSEYVFLEVNPNAQWAWIETLTKQPISEKLIRILTGVDKVDGH